MLKLCGHDKTERLATRQLDFGCTEVRDKCTGCGNVMVSEQRIIRSVCEKHPKRKPTT